MRGCGIFSHYLSISRNGRFKDVGIYTLVPQKAVSAFLAFKGADDAAKCMAESASDSGTSIRWKEKGCFASDGKGKSGKVEFFQ